MSGVQRAETSPGARDGAGQDTAATGPGAGTVVVVSAGRVTSMAVTRSLAERGVPQVVLHWEGDDQVASVSRHVREALLVPHPERATPAFVQRLVELAPRLGGALLVPTSDDGVKVLAQRRAELSRHYVVAAPEWSVAERFIDKRHTYELADRLGIPIPRTLAPDGAADVERYARQAAYPCLVKPRESHLYAPRFGEKVTVVRSPAELRAACAAAADAGLEVVLQELIEGPDHISVNYNAYRGDGELLAECTARKVRLSPPRFGTPRVVRSEHVPEVVAPGRAILEGLGLDGPSCTEFKLDRRDGTYKLLEVNGRHNRSSLLSTASGVNFPWIEFRHRTAGERPGPVRAREGLYWIDEMQELRYAITAAGRDGAGLRDLARPWLRDHVFAVFDPRDPAPFARELAWMGRRGTRALRRLRAQA